MFYKVQKKYDSNRNLKKNHLVYLSYLTILEFEFTSSSVILTLKTYFVIISGQSDSYL